MKLNPIGLSFTANPGKKYNLGEVKALKGLELDGVYVSPVSSAERNFNSERNKMNRDEFVMSNALLASKLAEKAAAENPNASFDDLFQDAMLKVLEYSQRVDLNDKKAHRTCAERNIRRAVQQPQGEEYEFLRDVNPVDSNDLLDVIIVKDAPDVISEIISKDLSPRQECIVMEKYGLGGIPKTGSEIAEYYEVPTTTIFEIDRAALKRLKNSHEDSEHLASILQSIEDTK